MYYILNAILFLKKGWAFLLRSLSESLLTQAINLF